jgi:hypothetical protein
MFPPPIALCTSLPAHSYRSDLEEGTGDGEGLILCEGVAQAIKKAGHEPFHGRMVKGGANWQRTWYGVMPEAKVAIVMFSENFFKSKACVEELTKICEESELSTRVIPVFVGHVNLQSNFLGTETKQQKRDANFIRTKINGNCIPPPDMGLFQDNWDANIKALITRINEMMP